MPTVTSLAAVPVVVQPRHLLVEIDSTSRRHQSAASVVVVGEAFRLQKVLLLSVQGGDIVLVPTDYGRPTRSRRAAVAARVCLRNSPYRSVRAILCECRDGILFLKGRLSSFYYKQVAQETVAKVKGVNQVVNEIDVD